MSAASGQAHRRHATLAAAAVGALAALTLLSVAPAAAAVETKGAPPPDHVVVFGALLTDESGPRDLTVDSGATIGFENHAALPALTPLRITIGTQTLVVGATPVIWTAAQSVRYSGTYTLFPGPSQAITVTAPVPGGPTPGDPVSGGGHPGPPPAPGSPTVPGSGTVPAQPAAAAAATKPVVPIGRPGDPGYVPAGVGIAPMAKHREQRGDSMDNTAKLPIDGAAPQARTHEAAMSSPSTAPLPIRVALAVFSALLLVGVGSALARILFRAWLNAAPAAA
ncbi:MAG: hypothetical protein DLM59_03205 [Pseudonocardiales bacterium]|nr:MAG: hypothetical protein DLM59_03205 [Pseudonocardiales bacterium]